MKILKKSVCLILAFAMLAGQCQSAQAAMSKSKQHKLYQKAIAKYHKTAGKCARKNGITGDTYYVFADIDKNGIDECILRFGGKETANTAVGSGYGENTSIYTIKNNKVKNVLDHAKFDPYCHEDYVHIFKRTNMIDMGFSHGYKDYCFYPYKNGKIDKKKSVHIVYSENEDHPVPAIDDKKTTIAACKKKYEQLTGTGKGYKMKKY